MDRLSQENLGINNKLFCEALRQIADAANNMSVTSSKKVKRDYDKSVRYLFRLLFERNPTKQEMEASTICFE